MKLFYLHWFENLNFLWDDVGYTVEWIMILSRFVYGKDLWTYSVNVSQIHYCSYQLYSIIHNLGMGTLLIRMLKQANYTNFFKKIIV